jgi:hypothetical protein
MRRRDEPDRVVQPVFAALGGGAAFGVTNAESVASGEARFGLLT